MDSNIILDKKPIGFTTIDMINYIKNKYNLHGHKIGLAGKLDPLASGDMIFMVDDACKLMSDLTKLDKIYTFGLVLGISTDTHDPMGLFTNVNFNYNHEQVNNDLYKFIDTLNNSNIEQPYPHYSSYLLKNNKGERQPLWWWAKNNRLDEIKIPTKNVNIYSIKIMNNIMMPIRDYIKEIKNDIRLITNNEFRQDEILNNWDSIIYNDNITIYNIECYVSSGTYIRSLAQLIGDHIGVPCHAFRIHRTKIIN